MKIALVGYGKMGKAIEEIVIERGHEIVLKITSSNTSDLTISNLQKADVAIEFTKPDVAFDNIMICLKAGVPTISGSTGWLQHLSEVESFVKENNGSFLYASNFSIGVNLFFELNQYLAKLMHAHEEYNPHLLEIHHTAKKDAPSGTGITLAEQVMDVYKEKKEWSNAPTQDPAKLELLSERVDPAPGTHIITYSSEIDDIEIKHTAHSRKGFAMGAVLAAEYVADKKGIFTMKQVLGL